MRFTLAQMASLGAEALARPVRLALHAPSAKIVDWKVEQIRAGTGGGSGVDSTGVFRYSGEATVNGARRPWSLILKVLYATANTNPSGSHYWRREAEVYRSGLLDSLPVGLSAPRCFDVWEHSQESCWLWLEDVSDEIGTWPLRRYGLVATQLGLFNAQFAVDRPLPLWPWLGECWIRKDLDVVSAHIDELAAHSDDPLIDRFFPSNAWTKLLRLWSERDRFLAAVESLPQTLCHYDAFRRNLFAQKKNQRTVLIDWSFVGKGPLGADIVSLVWVSLLFCEVNSADARELSDIVFGSYIGGLRRGGWRGDPDHVRLGYAAAMSLRRLGTVGYMLPVLLDPSKRPEAQEMVGRSMSEWADRFAEAGRFVDGLTGEARHLINKFRSL